MTSSGKAGRTRSNASSAFGTIARTSLFMNADEFGMSSTNNVASTSSGGGGGGGGATTTTPSIPNVNGMEKRVSALNFMNSSLRGALSPTGSYDTLGRQRMMGFRGGEVIMPAFKPSHLNSEPESAEDIEQQKR